jgi:hypothetical protein
MFTQAQAIALHKKIYEEAPYLDVQIQTEEPPNDYDYYLIVSQKGKMRFVVRDEAQWQERKHLVIA